MLRVSHSTQQAIITVNINLSTKYLKDRAWTNLLKLLGFHPCLRLVSEDEDRLELGLLAHCCPHLDYSRYFLEFLEYLGLAHPPGYPLWMDWGASLLNFLIFPGQPTELFIFLKISISDAVTGLPLHIWLHTCAHECTWILIWCTKTSLSLKKLKVFLNIVKISLDNHVFSC